MTTVILIRHGESEANRNGIFAGQIDPDLQAKGIKQAQLTAKYIAEHYTVEKIYSSDLKRAYKTALCLAELLGLSVIPKKELREIDGGEWEGAKFDELPTLFPEAFALWLDDVGASYCSGGESVKELGERIMNILTEIAEENDGKTVAVATHATPIRVVQTLIKTKTLDAMNSIPWASNASVTVLEYSGGVWSVRAEGLDEHLAELKTSLPETV